MADQPYTGPEVDAAVKILRDDAQAARDAKLMARLDAMEQRMQRMPVNEMSAEEKAAAWDKYQAEKDKQPPAPGPGQPPATDPTKTAPPAPAAKTRTEPPTPPARRGWWDGYQQ